MKNALCERLGIEFPLFAFSHCRDVVAAVSNAGGFGVLGASSHAPEQLEQELKWIDEHVGGKPYGVDILVPESIVGRDENISSDALRERVPEAAMMALGAAGAWTGTVWLMTSESEVSPALQEKFAAASSRDAVRSKSRTGKPSRQLRSAWTDAWEGPDSPGSLPMPLQIFLSDPSLRRADTEANRGHGGGRELATYFVGQGIGMLDSVKSTRTVVREFKEDFADAALHLSELVTE